MAVPRRQTYDDILDVIYQIKDKTGEWPTLAELAQHYGVQRPRVRRWISILEDKKLVTLWVLQDRSASYIQPTKRSLSRTRSKG